MSFLIIISKLPVPTNAGGVLYGEGERKRGWEKTVKEKEDERMDIGASR